MELGGWVKDGSGGRRSDGEKEGKKGWGGEGDLHNKCYVFLMKKGAFLDRYMTVERFIQNDCYFDILTIYCSADPPHPPVSEKVFLHSIIKHISMNKT